MLKENSFWIYLVIAVVGITIIIGELGTLTAFGLTLWLGGLNAIWKIQDRHIEE